MKRIITTLFLIAVFEVAAFGQKDTTLALTPPMGWNSWNTFACSVNETLIKEMADAMVASGMKAAGYEYINIDDCWQGYRDSLGFIHPDSTKFPSGMKALADYVHSKGLKLGIYSDVGNKTCAGYLGSRGHEYQDAMTYAKWGVDYLKYDWCNAKNLDPVGAYTTMRNALYATGRHMVFSICEWGKNKPWKWAGPIGHLWRATNDIGPGWIIYPKADGSWTPLGIMQIINLDAPLRKYAGPGHWNDADMLEVGNGLTENENRAHFSMWAMLSAPLIAGNDLRHMSESTKAILTNKSIIAVDQDSLGIQGLRYAIKDSVQVWVKPLKGDKWAVCFLNTASKTEDIHFNWKNNVVNDPLSKRELNANKESYTIKNLWTGQTLGSTNKKLKAKISSHDVLMIFLSRENK